MTFLNATLIFGMAAVAVPIMLHLIARREPRQVVFPSIRFLTRRFESNRSRLRVRRWWLLGLRIAALAILALALARPAIHQSLSVTWLTIGIITLLGIALLAMASVSSARGQSAMTSGGLLVAALALLVTALGWGAYTKARGRLPATDSIEPVSIAIVLDNSGTSGWKTASDDRIARMKDLANWMVTRLPRTSRIAIVDRSPQMATFAIDVATAISKIEGLRPLEVTVPIASRLEAAIRLVRTSDLPNRQVLLITDLAESTWQEATSETSLSMLLGDDPPVALTVLDLGPMDGINRSLSIPRLSDATPPRGTPVAIATTLDLTAGEGTDSVSVTAELEIFENDPSLPVVRDGVIKKPRALSVDRTSARVAPGGSVELLLTIPSLEVGTHHGQIRLVGDDALRLDDRRYFTLQVRQPASVLLASDDEDEARIISQAITASPGLIDPANAEFNVERIQSSDLSVVRPPDFDVVILLDPPPAALRDEALIAYARRGGGILISLGPSAGEARVESELLPTLVRRWRAPSPGTFFQVTASHPITDPVSADTPWADFRVYQYWQLQPAETDSVLIRYAGTQHGALVERLAGGDGAVGRVLVISTPIPALSAHAAAWNDLFGTDPWPAWLLTRQSVEYLAHRGESNWTVSVGQPQVIPLPSDTDDPSRSVSRIQLFPPGSTAPVPLEVAPDAKQVTVTDVPSSGTYWLRGAGEGAGFSANLPPMAIGLGRIGQSQLDQIFAPDQYTLVTDREGIQFAENKASQRVSLHSPAILLSLVVFLLEQILGNRFYRSPTRRATA